jgi:hypothetical protein
VSADAFLIVRSVVDEPLRAAFENWYAGHHLPLAARQFRTEQAWRFWSVSDPAVHYAVYRFADLATLNARLAPEEFRSLVEDYDRAWPQGVTRTREVLNLAERFGS